MLFGGGATVAGAASLSFTGLAGRTFGRVFVGHYRSPSLGFLNAPHAKVRELIIQVAFDPSAHALGFDLLKNGKFPCGPKYQLPTRMHSVDGIISKNSNIATIPKLEHNYSVGRAVRDYHIVLSRPSWQGCIATGKTK